MGGRPGAGARLRELAILTGAMAVISAAVFFFLVPSRAAVSSIAGAAIIINGVVDLPVSLITLILNGALIALGLAVFGGGFAFNTIYTCALLSAFMAALERLFPDIIAQVMNRYLHIEVGRALSIAGICIALCSAFVYDGRTVALSVLGTYFNGIVLDRFIFGQNLKRRVSVITKRFDELRGFILDELHCGATIYRAEGAYTHERFPELVMIVDKGQYQRLMTYVHRLDPEAFVAVYTVSEVSRKPWR